MAKREREYRRHGEGWDGRRCDVCGSQADIQHHHRKPHAQGGDDSEENLQPLCPDCHAEQDGKGHHLVKHMRLGVVEFSTVLEQRQYEESKATKSLRCDICGITIAAGGFIYVGGCTLEVCSRCRAGIKYQYEAREAKSP